MLILIPGAYPTTPPDNFYTAADLRLANGAVPQNATPAQPLDQPWLQFSFHVEGGDWCAVDGPGGHTLLDFLDGVAARLAEVD